MVIKGNEIRYHIQPITGIYVGKPKANGNNNNKTKIFQKPA
jgi:hypothetical protein